MAVVVPTVLAENVDQFHTKLDLLASFSTRLHIDLSDGEFAPTRTPSLIQMDLPTGLALDIHMMVTNPQQYLETLISLSPSLVILHAESQGEKMGLMQQLQAVGIKVGVALLEPTQPSEVHDLIVGADHVLIFTGKLGYNGGQFQAPMLEKIKEIRQIKSDIEIGVDGGVNEDNISLAVAAGVDVLDVGEYISSSPNPGAAFSSLSKLAEPTT